MKILLLRFSSIGDIVLTSPVIRCLKQQTGAELHMLSKTAFAPVLMANPHLSRVFVFNKDVAEVLPQLRSERYDWVIDLHQNLRSFRVKMALRRPSKSFYKLNLQKWLLVHTGLDLLPPVHIVERYMATVRHLGVNYDGQGLDYFIPQQEEVILSELSPNLVPEQYVVFVIGANHATKRLPEDKIAAVCRHMTQPVLLIGGKPEEAAGQFIAEKSGAHVFNLCGRLSLHQSASVIRQAASVITHDTGMMHIAAAFRKKIISIWGNTIPKFGMYPFYPDGQNQNTTIEVENLTCRPCSKIGHEKCPRKHFRCMNDLDLSRIWAAANDRK